MNFGMIDRSSTMAFWLLSLKPWYPCTQLPPEIIQLTNEHPQRWILWFVKVTGSVALTRTISGFKKLKVYISLICYCVSSCMFLLHFFYRTAWLLFIANFKRNPMLEIWHLIKSRDDDIDRDMILKWRNMQIHNDSLRLGARCYCAASTK